MARVLAVADEVDRRLYSGTLERLRPDLVVSCGDLPFDYLEFIVTVAGVPLVYVPGNHDPEVGATRRAPALSDAGLLAWIGLEARRDPEPGRRGPEGCVNVDGRVERVAGLRVGGLGGSIRYRPGPNQYGEREMRRRTRRLARRARRYGGLDLLVTHAPPRDLGDEGDPAHRGFEAFHDLIRDARPRIMVHGHVHPHGRERPDRRLGETLVVNCVPYRVLDLEA